MAKTIATYEEQVRMLQERTKAWRRALLSTPPSSVSGLAFCHQISDFLDATFREIYELAWQHAFQTAGKSYVEGKTEVALIATGGYGRRELCPFSDIDIAFVPSEEEHPFVDELIKRAFKLVVSVLMDATDLKVGYAYRPLSDIPQLDHTAKTALLDGRLVAGYEPLLARLKEVLFENLDVISFLQEKMSEREAWRARTHPSIYHSEPNIKQGAGSLRDLHSAFWMIQALHGTRDTRHKTRELEEALDFLLRVRNWLHLTSQRQNDVLLREYHHRIAADFGFGGDEKEAIRDFFHHFYTAAETIHRFATDVQQRLINDRLSLEDGFVAFNQQICPLSHDIFDQDPVRLLKAFELSGRYGFELSYEMLRLVREKASLIDETVRCFPEASQIFLSILTGGDSERTLHMMVNTGILQAYLPEFAPALHYVPANVGHDHTVGEHSLVVVGRLSSLTKEPRWSHTLIEDAWNEVRERNELPVLMLAALLHDVGKVQSESNHAELGAQTAEAIARRMGLEQEQVELVSQLVRRHLILLNTSRLRDTRSPETIRQAAQEVGDVRLLKMLYLLSYADAQSVGEKTFTDLDARLLDELYVNVLLYLTGEGEEVLEQEAASRRERVVREVRLEGVPPEEVSRFAEALPPSYLLNTPLPVIAAHLEFIQRLRDKNLPVVDVFNPVRSSFTEVTIVTFDDPQPGMLSKIAGTLYACDVDIRTANVFTLGEGWQIVLDTLWVTCEGGQLSEARAQRVQESLQKVLSGQETLHQILARNKKPLKVPVHVRSVQAFNDLSETHTVIHIRADDRKGLLYRLTATLAELGLDIHTAKIVTWGSLAEDAFYVTRKDGSKMPDPNLKALEEEMMNRLAKV